MTGGEQLNALIFLLIWAMTANFFAFRKGLFSLSQQQEPTQNVIVTFRDVFGVFSLFLLIQIVLVPVGAITLGFFQTGEWAIPETYNHAWISLIAIVASAIGIVCFCRIFEPKTAPLLEFGRMDKLKTDVSWGALCWFASFPVVSLIAQLFTVLLEYFQVDSIDQVAVKFLKETFNDRRLFWSSFWLIIFIVPFVEEVLFRGFLQTWLRQKFTGVTTIVITSLIFSCFHFSLSQGWHNLDLLIALFLLSCYLGILYEKRKSIWAPWALHLTFNAISEFAIVIQGGGIPA